MGAKAMQIGTTASALQRVPRGDARALAVSQRESVIQGVFNYVQNGTEFLPDSEDEVNQVDSTQPVGAADETAYVATVPTPGTGKDKTPAALAAQYAAEAFDTPADASRRLALMVSANTLDSVTEPEDASTQRLHGLAAQAQAVDTFRMGVTGFKFRVRWNDQQGDAVDEAALDQVRTNAQESPANTFAAGQQESAASKAGLVNTARNRAHTFHGTTEAVAHLRQRFNRVYIHVGDPDAVNLKAKRDPNNAAEQPSGLFDRLDPVVQQGPALASGGYRFRAGPPNPATDPHRGGAGNAGAQAAATSELDMRVRGAVTAVDPWAAYFPEPNLAIRSDIPLGDQPFGVGGPEWPQLYQSAAAHLVGGLEFDPRAAVYTDAGRWEQDVVGNALHGAAHGRGMTSPAALFDPMRAKQSHAKNDELLKHIRKLIVDADRGANSNKMLKAYLPQELFTTLKTDEDATRLPVLQQLLGGTIRGGLDLMTGWIETMMAEPAFASRADVGTRLIALGADPQIAAEAQGVAFDATRAGAALQPASRQTIVAIARVAGREIADFLDTFQFTADPGPI